MAALSFPFFEADYRRPRFDWREQSFAITLCLNVILSAAGMNFRKLLKWAADFLRQFFLWFLICQKTICCPITGKI